MTITKFVTVTLAALLLSTTLASAGGIGGLNEAVAPTAQDSLQDAVQTSSPSDSLNDAVQFDPIRDINDAVLDGANVKGKGGKRGVTGKGRVLELAFACAVGTGADLVVTNKGDAVPAGTKMKWEVRNLGAGGYFELNQELASGQKIRVADVAGNLDAGTKCAAKAI